MEYAKTSRLPLRRKAMSPMSPWRPASIITMKPTTTPGNARGKVSSARSRLRQGKRVRARKGPGAAGKKQGRSRDARREEDGPDKAAEVARIGYDGGVGGDAERPASRHRCEPRHRQQTGSRAH